MSSSQRFPADLNKSSEFVVNIQTANKGKMLPSSSQQKASRQQKQGASAQQPPQNYAQQLNGDLISAALQGSQNSNSNASSMLPPVPDSPSLQHQNMPRKQPIKAKLSASRQNSANSQSMHNPTSQNEHFSRDKGSRNSSRSGAMHQSNHSQQQQRMAQKQQSEGDFTAANGSQASGRRQKSRSSMNLVDSNQYPPASHQIPQMRRQSSSKGKKDLPPTHASKQRANSKKKLRSSQIQQQQDDNYSQASDGASRGAGGPLPPRRKVTQTSSARSLQPLPNNSNSSQGLPKVQQNASHTLNPNAVMPSPPSHLQQPSKKVAQMANNVDKHRELLAKLQEDRIRTEMELAQNAGMMEQRIKTLADERKNVERLILKATITIQRYARGFITRLKVRKVYHLQMEFEKARLDDALAQMQAMIAEQAKNVPITPAKDAVMEQQEQSQSQTQEAALAALNEIALAALNKVEIHDAKIESDRKSESQSNAVAAVVLSSRQEDVTFNQEAFVNKLSAQPDQQNQEENVLGNFGGVQEIETKRSKTEQTGEKVSQPSSRVPLDESRDDLPIITKEQQIISSAQVAQEEVSPIRAPIADTADQSRQEVEERGILDQLEAAESDYELDFSDPKYGKAALVIQRQAKVMVARNNFRVALYKLILIKNIVETKMHKERMQMLFAFEQLIINTEDMEGSEALEQSRLTEQQQQSENDYQTNFIEQTGLTREQIQEVLANETDPYLRQQLEELYNPLAFKGLNEAEQYFENTEDIINEEDLEESVCESRKQSPMAKNPSSHKLAEIVNESFKVAPKMSATAGERTQDAIEEGKQSSRHDQSSVVATSEAIQKSQEDESVSNRASLRTEGQMDEVNAAVSETEKSIHKTAQSVADEEEAKADQKNNFSQKLRDSLNSDLVTKGTTDGSEPAKITSAKATSQKSVADASNKEQIKPPTADLTKKTTASRPPSHQQQAQPIKAGGKPQVTAARPPHSKPLQERTITSTNASKVTPVRAPSGGPQQKPVRPTNSAASRTSINVQKTQPTGKRELSSEQGKQSTIGASSGVTKRTSTMVLSSKQPGGASTATGTYKKDPTTRQGQQLSQSALSQPQASKAKVIQNVTRKDIMEFSGATAPEELQQSGQTSSINIITAGTSKEAFVSTNSVLRQSDSGSLNGRASRQQRDNSIIERNKAKLAELAQKKKQEQQEALDAQNKKQAHEKETAKPPRPFDPTRMATLSQPKPKLKDPNTKAEQKPKRVSAWTRRQLQDRAERVKARQNEAMAKAQRAGSKMLAITDGHTEGSNLILTNEGQLNDPDVGKRRNNILKSRELRRRSASGRRNSDSGRGKAVFERLSAAMKDPKAGNKTKMANEYTSGRQALTKKSHQNQAASGALVPFEGQEHDTSEQLLAIEPDSFAELNHGDEEPGQPISDVRTSYEFIVKKSNQGPTASITISKQASKQVSQPSSSSNKQRAAEGGFELAGAATLTDNDESGAGTPGNTKGSYNPEVFTMRNLKKPAQAIQQQDEDDEMDDMPFIMPKGGSRRLTKKQTSTAQVNARQQDRQYLEPQSFGMDPLSQERKPITGASKISDSGLGMKPPGSQQSQQSYQQSSSTLQMFVNPKTTASQNLDQYFMPQHQQQTQQVVAKPDQEKDRDWLLDPVNLYMRGMAQKREQMRKLQAQIGQEQRAEINRRVAHFKYP